jgi:predicted O-linked N-acetylglucosamine transferase (SPINDLY family)
VSPAAVIETAREALVAGEADAAVGLLRGLIDQAPQLHDARYGLAAALAAGGDAAGAAQALDDARLLHAIALMRANGVDVQRCRADPAYAIDIGLKFYAARHVAIASTAFSLGVAAGYAERQGLLTYALSLQHQGRAEEATQVFAAVNQMFPSPVTHQFLLFSLFAVENGVERHVAEARRWGRLYGQAPTPKPFPYARDPNRRIRVGYVAPSFCETQSRQFTQPVMQGHDRGAFEVFAYPAKAETGDWAAEVTVRAIGTTPDSAALALIRADEIDILVDCWGHNAGNRLTMFARRAAPIQVSWLNYQQTTGVAAMDYVLHADSVDQPGMQDLFNEEIVRLGVTSAPFRSDARGTTPAPALRNGYVTFGSFINPTKLTGETVAGWAGVLSAQPGSKLVLKYGYFIDPVLQATTAARFAGHGVDPRRIVFQGHTTGDAYEAAFGEIDLALDPSPCPGGTTTLEALSRGVPVLTLAGETFYSRIGVQQVVGAGLSELVAESWDDYAARAAAASETPERLQSLRERAYAGFAAAPCHDEAAVVGRMEDAYRAMFARWISQPA